MAKRTVEYTTKELVKRFQNNGWDRLDLEMKTGDWVTITPCFYGDTNPTRPEDVEYFLLDSSAMNLCGSEKLEHIADTLNRFESLLSDDAKEKDQLVNFYNEHIAWATKEDWEKSHQVFEGVYESFRQSGSNWEKNAEECLPSVALNLGMELADAKKYLGLSEDSQFYSDWHKDLYGYRPR